MPENQGLGGTRSEEQDFVGLKTGNGYLHTRKKGFGTKGATPSSKKLESANAIIKRSPRVFSELGNLC